MSGSVGVFKHQVMEYKYKRADRGRAVAVMQSENSDSTSQGIHLCLPRPSHGCAHTIHTPFVCCKFLCQILYTA